MDKNTKVSNLYGRARRIEFAERIAYIVVGIIAIILVIFLVSKQQANVDRNVNFTYLREYMEAKGFNCEMLQKSGGQCTLNNEVSLYNFIRYENGFEYIVKTKSYALSIKHVLTEEDKITFRTSSEAFSGYKNKKYVCSYKDNVIKELSSCFSEDGEELDVASYVGVIKQAMSDLNNIIDSSGYDKNELMEAYQWRKK